MRWEKLSTIIYLILIPIYGTGACALFEHCWYTGILPLAVIAIPVRRLLNAIDRCRSQVKVTPFKIKLAIVISTFTISVLAGSIIGHFLFPLAILPCGVIGISFIAPHANLVEPWIKTPSLKSISLAALCLLVLIPLTSFCFTLSWTVTALPFSLLVYAFCSVSIAAEKIALPGFRRLIRWRSSLVLLQLSLVTGAVTAVAFFLRPDSFIVANAALATIALFLFSTQVAALHAQQRGQSTARLEVFVHLASSLAAAAVVGAARSSAVQPYKWEMGGAAMALWSVFFINHRANLYRRETDGYLERPKHVDRRFKKYFAGVASASVIMVMSIIGSYLYRDAFPSTSSPLPLSIILLLLFILFLSDCIREHISAKSYLRLQIVFGLSAVTLAWTAIAIFFFAFNYAIMEAIISALFVSICLSHHCMLTKWRMCHFATEYWAEQQAAAQNYIPRYFWRDIMPGA